MQGMLNRIFDEFFEDNINDTNLVLKENNNYNIEQLSIDTYQLTMSVPGYKKEDLEVTFNNGILLVKGKQKTKTESCNKKYLHRGFSMSSFENSFSLSNRLEVAEAGLKDGLLTIVLKDKTQNKNLISPIRRK